MAQAEHPAPETRELILATAEAHLRRYGYARTTVSEIARTCKMSHANVYRFFNNKAEIIDAVISRWLNGIEQALEAMTNQQNSAPEQLHTYVLELHRIKREKLSNDLELFEALIAVAKADRQVVERHMYILNSLLQEILRGGVERGEFKIANIEQASAAVSAATLKFHHPVMVKESLHENTEAQIGTVVKLLTNSLAAGCV
ncbi:MAG TPA: TetR family transcriptional regulator [Nodularia sp. (in: cyanobacteria)]|nr:TetR family transcriptional regulator [Nodularia sp. (in: cyanobacteria)]